MFNTSQPPAEVHRRNINCLMWRGITGVTAEMPPCFLLFLSFHLDSSGFSLLSSVVLISQKCPSIQFTDASGTE